MLKACLLSASRLGNEKLIRSLTTMIGVSFPQLRYQPFATLLHATVAFNQIKSAKSLLRYVILWNILLSHKMKLRFKSLIQINEVHQHTFRQLVHSLVLRIDRDTQRTPLEVLFLGRLLQKFCSLPGDGERSYVMIQRNWLNWICLFHSCAGTSIFTTHPKYRKL